MIRNVLIGREQECDRLSKCLEEERAQLIIVYGRRRVGKTYLISQFFSGRFDFKLTGVFKAPKETQLQNFILEMNRQTKSDQQKPENWTKAFEMLRSYISSKPEHEKCIVFFDEMPWMDSSRSDFLPAFEYFWNDYGCTRNNLVFIVCGSATSWMTTHIAKNKGGLFLRQTCSLYLNPFTLYETELYLKSRGIEWSKYDITECYMVMGGIPYYLSLLRNDLSLNENIDNLFFRKRAELWAEFDHLYNTLFSNGEQYVRIVDVLSRKKSGMTRSELSEKAKVPSNGDLSRILNDLVNSGFVRIMMYFGKKKKEAKYQLADYYSQFYFRFVRDNPGRDENFWSNMLDNPSRRAWEGLTFEQVCLDHIPQIKRKLGISGVLSEESSWVVKADPSGTQMTGAQIDLLIDRRDHVINICEDKFSTRPYEITKEDELQLRNKVEAFRISTGMTKTIQLTMITTFGIKKNKYSNLISNQVVLEDLFMP